MLTKKNLIKTRQLIERKLEATSTPSHGDLVACFMIYGIHALDTLQTSTESKSRGNLWKQTLRMQYQELRQDLYLFVFSSYNPTPNKTETPPTGDQRDGSAV